MKKEVKPDVEGTRKVAADATAASVAANSGIKTPTGAALASAQQEGVKEAVKEAAKDTYKALTDGVLLGETPARQFTGMDDIMQYEPLLGLGVEDFADAIAEKPKMRPAIPEEKVAGLLSLERAGQNRTPYVKALMDRLAIKHPSEVTNAGPGYTNDVHPISEL